MGDAAYAPDTLEAYLERRHADGDHLTLVNVDPPSLRPDEGDFGFVASRGTQTLPSKGAVECAERRFIVWSLGPNPGPRWG